jgi:hypothetical protein
MYVYSSAIIAFTKKLQKRALAILADEVGLEVKQKRFQFKHYSYPLSIHVFEGGKKLGYFDPRYFYIGVHKSFITCSDQSFIDNLLRHELAHYLCHINYPQGIQTHGSEFRELCRSYGWGQEVYAATEDLSQIRVEHKELHNREKIVTRIQKLLRLAENPSSPHEAQAASAKANQLLLKYHLQDLNLEEQEEEVYRQRVLNFKKRSGKSDAILHILNQFYVQAIYSSGQANSCIEVIGDRASVELADYMAKYLQIELEMLYKQAKKNDPENLKGLSAKNAFFTGLAEGYLQKIKKVQKQETSSTSALIAIEKKLERQSHLVYQGRLGSVSSTRQGHFFAQQRGKESGAQLQLRQGVGQKSGPGLLSFLSRT